VANSILIKVTRSAHSQKPSRQSSVPGKRATRPSVSHRSGETEDSYIADIAVAMNCGPDKSGSASAERTAREVHTSFLRIEEFLGSAAVYRAEALSIASGPDPAAGLRSPPAMLTERQKLKVLTGLGIELNRVKDLDILIEAHPHGSPPFRECRRGFHLTSARRGSALQLHAECHPPEKTPCGDKLPFSTFSIPINHESLAGYCVMSERVSTFADAYRLDASLPYRFAKRFDEASGYRTKSMLAVP